MANMQNSARQARERAENVLHETEKYVTGVTEDGKKLLYYPYEKVKDAYAEVNRAIGEINNILPQYDDTPAKSEMLELRSRLEERERVLRDIMDRK